MSDLLSSLKCPIRSSFCSTSLNWSFSTRQLPL